MFKIGDYVTRRKYNNDILFKIVDINNNQVKLIGVDIRLCADANIDDLIHSTIRKSNEDYFEVKKLNKDYFYIPGIILHLDSDEDYLKRCINYYKKNNIKCYGVKNNENNYINIIDNLIRKYNPSIIVITGHDAKNNKNKYKNSKYFIDTVKHIRNDLGRKDIVIIAGACQSDFINLIKYGSNFASSPAHINIHALDPAIIAANIALYEKGKLIDLNELLSKTKFGADGIGGINTGGVRTVGYPRKDKN